MGTQKGDEARASATARRGLGRSTPSMSRATGQAAEGGHKYDVDKLRVHSYDREAQEARHPGLLDRIKEQTPHDPNNPMQQSELDRKYNIDRDWKERDSPEAQSVHQTLPLLQAAAKKK